MNAALCCALAAAALLVAALLRKRMVLRRDPAGLDAPLPPSTRLGSVEDFLRARESAAAPIAPGAESSIIWAAGRRGERADYALVFLHGWSASSLEIDPVDARIAAEIGAHCVRFRLTGHGLKPVDRGGDAMRDEASSDEFLRDAATAFAIGRLVARRVILVGCSTGGTLAVRPPRTCAVLPRRAQPGRRPSARDVWRAGVARLAPVGRAARRRMRPLLSGVPDRQSRRAGPIPPPRVAACAPRERRCGRWRDRPLAGRTAAPGAGTSLLLVV